MAEQLDWEAKTAEERAADRDSRRKRMEDWPQQDPWQAYVRKSGQFCEQVRDTIEAIIPPVHGAEPDTPALTNLKTLVLTRLRELYQQTAAFYQRTEISIEQGPDVAEAALTKPKDYGLSEEQQKLMKAAIKQKEEAAGGKWKRTKMGGGGATQAAVQQSTPQYPAF